MTGPHDRLGAVPRTRMKKLLFIAAIALAVYGFLERNPDFFQSYAAQSGPEELVLKNAFENRQSNLQVSGSGTVIRILPDDTQGRRHQKFILRLLTGQTILIAHNIDLAPINPDSGC
jgi:hypothetical protein